MTPTDPMTPLERAVLTVGLPVRAASDGHPPAVADPESFRLLMAWAVAERLTGLLCQAIDDGSIVLDTPSGSSLADEAREAHRTVVRHTLGAEATAIEVVELLSDHGMVAYPFKGVANAHLDYPDPALRTFLDADIHVERHQFGDAITALLAAGYTRTSVPLGERWERRFGPGVRAARSQRRRGRSPRIRGDRLLRNHSRRRRAQGQARHDRAGRTHIACVLAACPSADLVLLDRALRGALACGSIGTWRNNWWRSHRIGRGWSTSPAATVRS